MANSVSSSLSAGAQVLQNDGMLPSNLSQSDLAKATPQELTKMAGAQQALTTTQAFGYNGTSSQGDTVDFSAEALHALTQQGHSSSYLNGHDVSSSLLASAYSAHSNGFEMFA